MDLLRGWSFNSIRVPVSFEIAMNLDHAVNPACVIAEPGIAGWSARRYVHHLFYHAKIRGMSILLDLHSDHGAIQPSPTSRVSLEDNLEAWRRLLLEYGSYDNLIGIDVRNEPHGTTTWEQWFSYTQALMRFVRRNLPSFQGLFWIQGIEESDAPWGGSFRTMSTPPGKEPDNRIVFSPHVYGVSVRGIDTLSDANAKWEEWFGFLTGYYDNPVCIGEIGGWNAGPDADWHRLILDYLKSHGITNFYYWCLNPDSIDTGGLLAMDWTTVDQNKIDWCYNLQPDPTFVPF
jgi:endoglucanase